MNWRRILLGTGLLSLSCHGVTLAKSASKLESYPQIPTPPTVLQLAQTPPNLPPGILEPTRPGLPPIPSTSPETPTPPTPLTPPAEIPLTPPTELGVKVNVKRVEVLGSTVFSPQELEAAVASFIGQEATFEDLLAIRAAITQLYTDQGYTTSGACQDEVLFQRSLP